MKKSDVEKKGYAWEWQSNDDSRYAGWMRRESGESKDTAMVQTGEDGVVESGRYTLDADTPAWKLDTKEDTTLTWYVNAEWWNTEWGNDVVHKTDPEGHECQY